MKLCTIHDFKNEYRESLITIMYWSPCDNGLFGDGIRSSWLDALRILNKCKLLYISHYFNVDILPIESMTQSSESITIKCNHFEIDYKNQREAQVSDFAQQIIEDIKLLGNNISQLPGEIP